MNAAEELSAQERADAKLLEKQIKDSIRYKRIEDALIQALLLMRAECASLCSTSTTRDAAMSVVMDAAIKLWANAILAAEKALLPVTATPEPKPQPACAFCGEVTPGTIMGLCLKCDELAHALAGIIVADEEFECEVIEIPRRIQ